MTEKESIDPCEHRDKATGEPVCSRWSTHRHRVREDEIILVCDTHACAECVRYRGKAKAKKRKVAK